MLRTAVLRVIYPFVPLHTGQLGKWTDGGKRTCRARCRDLYHCMAF